MWRSDEYLKMRRSWPRHEPCRSAGPLLVAPWYAEVFWPSQTLGPGLSNTELATTGYGLFALHIHRLLRLQPRAICYGRVNALWQSKRPPGRILFHCTCVQAPRNNLAPAMAVVSRDMTSSFRRTGFIISCAVHKFPRANLAACIPLLELQELLRGAPLPKEDCPCD